jgi:hypothetical protein
VRLRDVTSMRQIHYPDLADGAPLLLADLTPMDPARLWEASAPEFRHGRINHYWTRSFEEFSIKKARGDTLTLAENDYARDFKLFFVWNRDEAAGSPAAPAAAFLDAVEAERARILALPGVGAAMDEIERRFPAMLARFDASGGLAAIYDRVRDEWRGGRA